LDLSRMGNWSTYSYYHYYGYDYRYEEEPLPSSANEAPMS
jgi:hypothetical protein